MKYFWLLGTFIFFGLGVYVLIVQGDINRATLAFILHLVASTKYELFAFKDQVINVDEEEDND